MAEKYPAPEIRVLKRASRPTPRLPQRASTGLLLTVRMWWRRQRAWAEMSRRLSGRARGHGGAGLLLPSLPPQIQRDLWAGVEQPIAAPSDYRWGKRCHSCEVILTPFVAAPSDYRRCRLCWVLSTLLRAQRGKPAGAELDRDRALFHALLRYRPAWEAAITRRVSQVAPSARSQA